MPAFTLTDVQAFAARHLPGTQVTSARSFTGGFWNEVQHLTTSRGDLVFKRYRPIPPDSLFPNLPQDEALALARLAGLNVAPDLVGFWPAEQVLIYHFIPGPEWRDDVQAAAQLLRRQAMADPTGFRPVPVTAAAILAQGDRDLAACVPDPVIRHLKACRPTARPSDPAPTSLIHTDPAAANLVGTGAGLRLIDWQCPAAGDLAEDVAVLLSPAFRTLYNRPLITPAQRRLFLDTLADSALERRLPALEPAYGWRLATYCARRMQTTPDPTLARHYQNAALADAARLETL